MAILDEPVPRHARPSRSGSKQNCLRLQIVYKSYIYKSLFIKSSRMKMQNCLKFVAESRKETIGEPQAEIELRGSGRPVDLPCRIDPDKCDNGGLRLAWGGGRLAGASQNRFRPCPALRAGSLRRPHSVLRSIRDDTADTESQPARGSHRDFFGRLNHAGCDRGISAIWRTFDSKRFGTDRPSALC